MTVIAFRPRPRPVDVDIREDPSVDDGVPFKGVFRSPQGRAGTMGGLMLLQRLVIIPRGVFVTGRFTGELFEPDGTLIGADSRLCTVAADLRLKNGCLEAVIRPLQLDLFGIAVDVIPFAVAPSLPFPPTPIQIGRRRRSGVRAPTRIHPQ